MKKLRKDTADVLNFCKKMMAILEVHLTEPFMCHGEDFPIVHDMGFMGRFMETFLSSQSPSK